ncbi:MAG: DUF4031 domain-containing protein [Beutenbergiaceae bacterium]
MAILIDPPRWEAHGTTFSHLVSDSSLSELHAFAASNGIQERAFDADHYDVPVHLYESLVQAGALPVTGRELIRRLRGSGLRVTSRERPRSAMRALRHRWPGRHLAAATSPSDKGPLERGDTSTPATEAIRDDLLRRWSAPGRNYHDGRHLLAVLNALDSLTDPVDPPLTVILAAWFHDAVYEGVPGTDEQSSADLARSQLRSVLAPDAIDEVARLVLITTNHQPVPTDQAGVLLCDADLAILGSSPTNYRRYCAEVRRDYDHLDEASWSRGRIQVLQGLLQRERLFHTEAGYRRWEWRARENLQHELADLTAPTAPG